MMSKSRRYVFLILGSLLVLLGIYNVLVQSGVLQFSSRLALIVSFGIAVIFLSGIPLIVGGFKGDAERFVGRFLVLTTVQLLLAMIIMLAFVVSKLPNSKLICLHFIALFVVFLTIQSLGLVKVVKS